MQRRKRNRNARFFSRPIEKVVAGKVVVDFKRLFKGGGFAGLDLANFLTPNPANQRKIVTQSFPLAFRCAAKHHSEKQFRIAVYHHVSVSAEFAELIDLTLHLDELS